MFSISLQINRLKQEEEEDLMFAEKMKAEAERVEKEQVCFEISINNYKITYFNNRLK